MGALAAVFNAIAQFFVGWFKSRDERAEAEKVGGLAQTQVDLEAENEMLKNAADARAGVAGNLPGRMRDGSLDPDCRDCAPD